VSIDLRSLSDGENIALIVVAIGVIIALAIAFGVVYATARRNRK
jgi:hypothetical protein